MYYCDTCKAKNKWPLAIVRSRGTCECCGVTAMCNDIPASELPPIQAPAKLCPTCNQAMPAPAEKRAVFVPDNSTLCAKCGYRFGQHRVSDNACPGKDEYSPVDRYEPLVAGKPAPEPVQTEYAMPPHVLKPQRDMQDALQEVTKPVQTREGLHDLFAEKVARGEKFNVLRSEGNKAPVTVGTEQVEPGWDLVGHATYTFEPREQPAKISDPYERVFGVKSTREPEQPADPHAEMERHWSGWSEVAGKPGRRIDENGRICGFRTKKKDGPWFDEPDHTCPLWFEDLEYELFPLETQQEANARIMESCFGNLEGKELQCFNTLFAELGWQVAGSAHLDSVRRGVSDHLRFRIVSEPERIVPDEPETPSEWYVFLQASLEYDLEGTGIAKTSPVKTSFAEGGGL